MCCFGKYMYLYFPHGGYFGLNPSSLWTVIGGYCCGKSWPLRLPSPLKLPVTLFGVGIHCTVYVVGSTKLKMACEYYDLFVLSKISNSQCTGIILWFTVHINLSSVQILVSFVLNSLSLFTELF